MVKFRLICFTVLIASLRKKKNNVLRLLLTLECLVLFLFIVLCFLGEIYFRVIFLSVGACEAAVGLGCLVGLIRLAGQNHISFTECGPYCLPTCSRLINLVLPCSPLTVSVAYLKAVASTTRLISLLPAHIAAPTC